MVKQRIDSFCQADDSNQSSDPPGNQYLKIQMADTVHERRIKPQRHQKGGKAHARCDHAQSQAESAEQVGDKVCLDLYRSHVQPAKQSKYYDHTDHQGNVGAFCYAFLPSFPEQRGEHPADQSDKQADRRIRIFIQEKGQQIGDAKETDGPSDKHRNQRRNVSFKIFERVR